MAFDPDAYLAGSSSTASNFDPDEYLKKTEPKSIGGFAKNAIQDVKDTGVGLGHLARNFVAHPVDTTVETVKNVPGALIEEGKRIGAGELLTGHPIKAGEKFLEAGYEKPLTTAFDVMGAEGALKGGMGLLKNGLRVGAEIAPEVAKAAETTAAPSSLGEIGSKIKNAVPKEAVAPLEEVKNYVSSKYGKMAEKPGWSDTLAEYLTRHSQNMSLKNLGASPYQFQQLGAEPARALGKFALEKDITSPFVGEIGMEQKVAKIADEAGSKIGAARKLADSRGGAHDINHVIETVRNELDPIYLKGIESGQKGSYMKALDELKRANPTHEGLAGAVTKLNSSATSAKRLKQADSAISDVANRVSRYNNESISKFLKPSEVEEYHNALKEYGASKKINQFLARKESREATGRMGPGGGLRHLSQNFLDSIGYKAQARIAQRLADFVKKNPESAKDLPGLFKEYVHQAEDIVGEAGDNIQ